MYQSLCNANVVKLFSHYHTASELIRVGIHQSVLLQCSLRQPEYGMLIGWFSCPTCHCNNEWDKHWIADIHFMQKVTLENPHYSVFLNGTLLIEKILPMHDGRYFPGIPGYKFSHKQRIATQSHGEGSSVYQMPSEDLNFLNKKTIYGALHQQYLGVWLTYHCGSYTSFYGPLFICIGALFFSVKKIIYLLFKDYYTLKTMAEVSIVFSSAFRHPRPFIFTITR